MLLVWYVGHLPCDTCIYLPNIVSISFFFKKKGNVKKEFNIFWYNYILLHGGFGALVLYVVGLLYDASL